MDKLKIRFYCDDIEDIENIELDKNWTWEDIEIELDRWLRKSLMIGYEMLEINGKPYTDD